MPDQIRHDNKIIENCLSCLEQGKLRIFLLFPNHFFPGFSAFKNIYWHES